MPPPPGGRRVMRREMERGNTNDLQNVSGSGAVRPWVWAACACPSLTGTTPRWTRRPPFRWWTRPWPRRETTTTPPGATTAATPRLALGKALARYPREKFYIADKFPGYDLANMPKVKEIFEEQLKKCQVDHFDFYLFSQCVRDEH